MLEWVIALSLLAIIIPGLIAISRVCTTMTHRISTQLDSQYMQHYWADQVRLDAHQAINITVIADQLLLTLSPTETVTYYYHDTCIKRYLQRDAKTSTAVLACDISPLLFQTESNQIQIQYDEIVLVL